jgi:hypothetical protein
MFHDAKEATGKPEGRPSEYAQALGEFATHFSRGKEGDSVTLWVDRRLWLFSITLPEEASSTLDREMEQQRRTPTPVFDPKYRELTAILGDIDIVKWIAHLIRKGNETGETYGNLPGDFDNQVHTAGEEHWMAAHAPGIWVFSTALSEDSSKLLAMEWGRHSAFNTIFSPKEFTVLMAEEGIIPSLTSLIRNDAATEFNETHKADGTNGARTTYETGKSNRTG